MNQNNMPATSKLYRLIKSMDVQEKKFFRSYQFMISGKKDSMLLKLYEVLDSMDDFDEDRFKQKIKGKAYAAGIAVKKVYLEEALLKALTVYQMDRNPRNKTATAILSSRVLFDRGLDDMAFKQMEKARALATEYEYPEEQLVINDLHLGMVSNDLNKVRELIGESALLMKQIENRNTYFGDLCGYKHNLVKLGISSKEKLRAEIHKILNSEAYSGGKQALSRRGNEYRLTLMSELYYAEGKYEEAYAMVKEEIAFWDRHQAIASQNGNNVLKRAIHAMICNFMVLRIKPDRKTELGKEAKEILDLMKLAEKEFITKTRFKALAKCAILEYDMYYHLYYKKTEEFIRNYQWTIKEIEKYDIKTDISLTAWKTSLHYHAASFLFASGKNKLAEEIVSDLMNLQKKDLATDVLAYTYFLSIMVSFDKGQFSLMQSRIGTLERHLTTHSLMGDGEKKILNYMKGLIKKAEKEDRVNLFSQMKATDHSALSFQTDIINSTGYLKWLDRYVKT